MPCFEHFGLSNILPGDCHVASLLAMTVVVVTQLRRFKRSDKLKFENSSVYCVYIVKVFVFGLDFFRMIRYDIK